MPYSIYDDYDSEYALKSLPLVIPTSGIFDSPLHSVCINSDWLAILHHALDTLDDSPVWDDSTGSIEFARNEIRELIAKLAINNYCAGQLVSDANCYEYPSYSPFIEYYPMNPFNEQTVPSGYLTPPFTKFSDFGLLGWMSNYFPSFTESLTGYQPNDLIVDLSSIPIVASWQDIINGVMPQITINLTGTGIIELNLLSFPLGGRAIITVDEYPNIADIFLGILGNGISIELERDITSLPIESDSTVIEEIEITESGNHQVHITFIPVVDDSSIPVKFGGGFRGVELCGFDEIGVIMGITDIRINDCTVQTFQDGIWQDKFSLLDCAGLATQSDVTSLTGLISDNIAAINTNANNITTNTNAINVINTVDLPQIAINQQSTDDSIAAIEATVTNHTALLDIHADNLTLHTEQIDYILDNLPAGSGITAIAENRITQTLIQETTLTAPAYDIDIVIPAGFDRIRIEYLIYATNDTFQRVRMYINQDYIDGNYQSDIGGTEFDAPYITQYAIQSDLSTPIMGFLEMPYAGVQYGQIALSESGMARWVLGDLQSNYWTWNRETHSTVDEIRLHVPAQFNTGTIVRAYGYKDEQILLPQPPVAYLSQIDFSTGSSPYTLESGTSVLSGGNQDDCAGAVNVNYGAIGIEVDLQQLEDVSWVRFDLYMNDGYTNNVEWRVYDGLGNQLNSDTVTVTQGQWVTINYYPTGLNTDAILIRLYGDGGGSNHTLKIDNIIIN